MKEKIRWGIIGPGVIAHSFMEGLALLEDACVTAVASRTPGKAAEFARQYGIPKVYDSYEGLARDPEVDIVYVATVHPVHRECTRICLMEGKAVLCEKPFTINAAELEELIGLARQRKLFLMEGMWTRFLPAVSKTREWLATGTIGEVRMARAEFGIRCGWNPESRLLNPVLGGGALLDIGIYPISLISMVYGRQPSEITSMAHLGETNVDEQFTALFGYGDGRMASVSGAVRTLFHQDAWIYGTEGWIHIPNFMWAKTATLCIKEKPEENFDLGYEGPGYQFEAAEAMACLREGRLESSIMPLDESFAIMKTLDQIRKQWNFRYPFEQA